MVAGQRIEVKELSLYLGSYCWSNGQEHCCCVRNVLAATGLASSGTHLVIVPTSVFSNQLFL